MISGPRRGASLRLPALFVLLASVPLIGLSWLGWQLLQRETDLEQQRERNALENAASLVTRELERSWIAWEDLLRAAIDGRDPALPDNVSMLTFDGVGSIDRRGAPLAYLPIAAGDADGVDEVFAAAEALEFRTRDLSQAIARYRTLTGSADPRVRAGALLRLARSYQKQQQRTAALAAYGELAAMGHVVVAGAPAELLARRERIALLTSLGDGPLRSRETDLMAAALSAGRFPIDAPTFEFFRESTPSARVDRAALHRAEAAVALWPAWRDQPSGRTLFAAEPEVLACAWRRSSARTAVILAPADVLLTPVVPLLSNLAVDVTVIEGGGRIVWGSSIASARAVTRSPQEIRQPWSIRVAASDPGSAADLLAARRRVLFLAFGLMVVVMGTASYAVFRAVSRELRVAQLQSDFLAAVSHEFRTPLTAMNHLTTMLEEGASPAPMLPQYYQALAKETRRLRGLVESLLDFGRTDAGRRAYDMTSVGVTDLVHQVVEQARETLLLPPGRVVVDLPEAPCHVRADAPALALVLRNLLDNAVKYSPDSSPIRVSVTCELDTVAIAVQDSGAGIPVAERRDIFRKFVRGSAAKTLNVKGTGIGLTMAKHVVTAHGGELTLSSELGHGSRFVVTLPYAARP